MKIVHFDVDEELNKYLEGQKYPNSLQQIHKEVDVESIEGISVKTGSKVDKDTLSQFSNLKLLVTRTVGTDHIDLNYCQEKSISVYHILDYGAFNIAEHAFALLLAGTRNIITTQKDIQAGRFSFEGHLGFSLKGKILGVVGTGRIGLEMIKRANGFGMEVVAFDVFKNDQAQKELGFIYMELNELLATSDVISLHAPLLDSTLHMINSTAINQMKDGIVLINTARGELIHTEALVNNIRKFRFVGLDVLEGEKGFSKGHPLLDCPNVIITPHMAFYSDSSIKKIAEETERLIQNYQSGNKDGKVI